MLGAERERFTVRIFATDLDPAAVAYARRGVYSRNALAPLPPDLVERYFIPLNGAYEVSKLVRSLVVFGEHDLGQRAPFPHIDLCLCRNVLIYFNRRLQDRVHHVLYDSLANFGVLGLGAKETLLLTPLQDRYEELNAPHRLYRRMVRRSRCEDRVDCGGVT